jgi:hypothetical protein
MQDLHQSQPANVADEIEDVTAGLICGVGFSGRFAGDGERSARRFLRAKRGRHALWEQARAFPDGPFRTTPSSSGRGMADETDLPPLPPAA